MNNKATTTELHRLLSILTTGSREEVRNAKKTIEKLWHRDNKQFRKRAPVTFEYIAKFDQIEKAENQAAFASGLSLFYLALSDEYFNTLKDFTLKALQHPHGHVREAIRKTADWLFMSLTSRARPFVYPKGKELNQKQKIMQQEARQQYISLVSELEFLIDKYDHETENVQYVDEMKPSINKSLQLFWSRLTESLIYRELAEQNNPIPHEILMKRKEIENKLSQMLKKTESDCDLKDIKETIYHEDGQDALTDLITMFDTGNGKLEINDILETLNDAWNYFPHKLLGGLSPVEKVLENKLTLRTEDKLIN